MLFKYALAVTSCLVVVTGLETELSHDGTCGNGVSCMGSMFGGCCSASGKCGATLDHCGRGCQPDYGYCQDRKGMRSPDGTCGGGLGYTCKGSDYGNCCSQYQYCGGSNEHCGVGCLSGFGDCSPTIKLRNLLSYSRTSPRSTPTTFPTLRERRDDAPPVNVSSPATTGTLECPEANNTIFTTDCGAKFRIECGLDRRNGDIWYSGNGFGELTLQDCISACSQWPSCVNVNWFVAFPKGPCYIKDTVMDATFDLPYVQGGVMVQNCTRNAPVATPSWAFPTTVASSTTVTATTTLATTTPATTTPATTTPATMTTITPITEANSSTSTNSGSLCASGSPKPTGNEQHERCVPCEGQGGTLPYCGADAFTNPYEFTPRTCRTVYYNFEITNITASPDGRERIALVVNGQLPGPPIEASWGDTIMVTVANRLQDNGTSIHFHGMRQMNNSDHDGVPSLTQCPIAPGDSMTYKFVASNVGTSWYHSHYALQAWEGVYGPMIIHGPTSKHYDVDAGTIMLQDWSKRTVSSMYNEAQDAATGGPRIMENGLINGMNTWGPDGTNNQTGQRFELSTKFEPGKTYLFRIVNAAIQSTYKFFIDGHTMEVINMDFTNIKPYKTKILNINDGQRYMVIVRADQPVRDYWMRADNQNACAGTRQSDDIKGIVRYAGSPGVMPTTTKYNYTSECVDEPLASLIPLVPLNPTDTDETFTEDITIAANNKRLFKWYLSGTSFYAELQDPTLMRVLANGSEPTLSGDLTLDLPDLHQWVYVVIESRIPLPHPIHIHGHDFFILAAGTGVYTPGLTKLNLNNPPRRDTANMPAAGYLVVAFETDNPGAWLMHCHIGWHSEMGFALQILEAKSTIKETVGDGVCTLEQVCGKWGEWTKRTGFYQPQVQPESKK
ncbi:multicopper oxidase-domain-containing protein [Massariosphaeria phaeospora]|uniref:Multicopper oxidase-domain-containing protein n=1 Tax=Massariosphaeria phaeospora TaxID=100035 RepID=A0A7C8IAC4_9PLEO|nr:multicopper oxidase-domain-containing protein [Massariosphaeria phaeospora]